MRAMLVVAGLVLTLVVPVGGATAAPADYPDPGRVTGSVNGVHDPTMQKAADGRYLLVSTGNNLPIRTSTDRVAYRTAGSVWPNGAPWAHPFTNGTNTLWAPDLSFRNGRYYLYYSASTFGSRNSAIFLATSPTAASSSWTNLGIVWQTNNSNDYNAIDPNLVVDAAGAWWLSFGSFWTGIKMIRIDPATGKQHATDRTLYNLARRPTAGGAIEAPFIVRQGGFYYMFVSFDLCCRGTNSTYRIMVGRSASITGPYVDRAGVALNSGGGTEILAAHGSVVGPGHQAVFQDADAWVLAYHYYTSSAQGGRLGLNLIDFSDGWPRVF
ncbi:MAG TPA: arabinan endo-1,5-alpha-L-arabinosidase [Actinophytocola sp.]|uniref:arabinan endo-1,5-alpha-L-arabinosidase n=1 Tax=Actinophytocola sp. TaxID=1872138 RepID=UPI002DB5A2B2|nr:arabinan endo-1,5-alpha-L-arabinosidase [Actinophytocola sp.]HEU5470260.1 arabinan endo-1,5-alpha-L-arabinosidase [Actinophytocola sp.]